MEGALSELLQGFKKNPILTVSIIILAIFVWFNYKQVSNHIPTEIKELSDKVDRNHRELNDKIDRNHNELKNLIIEYLGNKRN